MVITLTIMDNLFKRNQILMDIIQLIGYKPYSISELGRKLNLNRSTLRYYLSLLKQERIITFDRQVKSAGRPTIIKLDAKGFEEKRKEIKEQSQKLDEENKKNPYVIEILELLFEKPKLQINDFFEATKELESLTNATETIVALSWLKIKKYVNEFYEISLEGKQFLKEKIKPTLLK